MESLREMLKRHEALRLTRYIDTLGYATIGWGHQDRDVPEQITQEQAEEWLTRDIRTAMNAASFIWPNLNDFDKERYKALIDLVFNMGGRKIETEFPSFVKAVNLQDWEWAADELKYVDGKKKDKLSDYWKQTGDRAKEIVKMIREG